MNAARLVRVAVLLGVVAVLAAGVLVGVSMFGGPQGEEAAARDFLEAFFADDAAATYEATAPSYRSIVLEGEHARLVREVAAVAGGGAAIEIVGSQPTPATDPPASRVAYRGRTDAGTVEGVVTLLNVDGEWLVRDVSYDFPDAPPAATEDLDALTRELNEQLQQRAGRARPATPAG